MSEEEKNENVADEKLEVKVEEAPPKGKSGKKKLLKIGLISLAVILSLLIGLSVSLGFIIKGAVNHVLPTITGTPSSMDSCYLNLLTGTLSIKNFVIGNPEGYETPHAFKLGEVYVDIALTSLMSDKIVIQDITVDNMEVSFEAKLTETNIGVIKDNIDKLSKEEDKAEGKPDKDEGSTEPEEDSGGGKKLQIDNFMFINSKVHMHAGVGTSMPLPEIKITGIGSDSEGGASVTDVSEEVYKELYMAILKAVGNINSEDLEKGTNTAIDKAKEGTDAVIKGVKDLFGGEEK
jgi:hypothetical protein